RSAGGFVLGMVLASLYGAVVLLAQGHDVWYCLATTSSLGAALGLGMAFSAKMRVTVLLSLPHIFTREGKMLLLLVALGMAVQGPCANVLQNFSRAAESLSCGAELTLNQTAERLQRAQEPLLGESGERGMRWERRVPSPGEPRQRWMVPGCPRPLGYRRQRCVPPSPQTCWPKSRRSPRKPKWWGTMPAGSSAPSWTPSATSVRPCPRGSPSLKDSLERIRREFEFNISATHHFNVSLGASRSLGEVATDIMEGVRQRLEPTRRLLGLFLHFSFCAILYLYLQAVRYHHRYLRDDTFDNVYITRRFVELDLRRAEQGRATVLPLTARECTRYVSPAGIWLSYKERRRYGLQVVAVLRHVLLGVSVILADYSLFWLLDLIRHLMQGEIVARAPVVLGISVNGSGYTSKIFRDVVSAFDVLQRGNVSVLSRRCVVHPAEPDY
ncbi:DCST2 protein, partial [Rhinoptilus africanus]|nr:DCST2 protein [Rhinoptilus africanus]